MGQRALTNDLEQTEYTESDEANVRRYLKRKQRSFNRQMDKYLIRELEDIFAGRSDAFNRLREGESFSQFWRSRDSVVPNHKAEIVFTKKDGKPVITILDTAIPDEATAIETKSKQIESGQDSEFNDLPEGGEYQDHLWEGPGKDIWHIHELKVAKKNGKPVITIVEYTMHYATKGG